jgi:hypothetical protein
MVKKHDEKPVLQLFLGPFKGVQNTKNAVFGHFWAIWAPPIGPRKVLKGLQ